jgi:hypothetical protein
LIKTVFDHDALHGTAQPSIVICHRYTLLIRVVGSAVRQTWLKVAAGR